jgi:hypothetical protein
MLAVEGLGEILIFRKKGGTLSPAIFVAHVRNACSLLAGAEGV